MEESATARVCCSRTRRTFQKYESVSLRRSQGEYALDEGDAEVDSAYVSRLELARFRLKNYVEC